MSPAPPPPKKSSSRKIRAFVGGQPFGSYVLDERIAVGGTAEVYVARPNEGSLPAPKLVIKRLIATLLDDGMARTMFAEEAALHRRFVHKNIVACYGAGAVDGEPFLAMELVHGADLHRILRLSQTRRRPVPPPLAVYIAREMLAALEVVHAARSDDGTPLGVVHRDVSPSNIYLSTNGDVKLGDFGIAHPSAGKARSATGTGLRGKFAYLAPEQVASEPIDPRADLFAVANVLAEMMLGRPLFPGSGQLAVLLAIRDARVDAIVEQGSSIPQALVPILKRALSKNPGDRYPDAKSFSDALAPFGWHDQNAARREVAQLVRWARETSLELRALGKHPSSNASEQRPIVGAPPPTTGAHVESAILPHDLVPETPRPTPGVRPPSVPLDPKLLDTLEVREVVPQPSLGDAVVTAPFSPPPSRVRCVDGRTMGPYHYAKLMELIATGRIEEDDEIDFMGTGFIPLRDIDELSRHIAPRSSTTKQIKGPGAPDWHGLIAERYDPDIGGAIDPGIGTALGWAAARRANGVLLATHQRRRKEIYFREGRVHHVASTDAGEMIGEYLVSRDLIDRADLDFALAVLPRFGGRLGEALTGLGLIAPVAMFKAIQEQGRDKVVDVFRWSDGDLSFYMGEEPVKVDFPLDLAIGPVVEAGVAAMLDDEKAVGRYEGWLDRKVVVRDAAVLRDAGWSPIVERVVACAAAPILVHALLRTLAGVEGTSESDAARAAESARIVGMIDWH